MLKETGRWSRHFIFSSCARDGGGLLARKEKKYYEIRTDLLDQLERNGTFGEYYIDLIEDYMSLYETKNMLKKDILERGVTVIYNNGGGQSGVKKNDSIEQLLKVNTQMIKILDAIGIKAVPEYGCDDDDEL